MKAITLRKPVEYRENPESPESDSNPTQTLNYVTLKNRPTVGDQMEGYRRSRDGNESVIQAYLIARAYDIPFTAIVKIDMADYEEMVAEYRVFMESPLTTS